MQKILYLHGYGSNGSTESAQFIRSKFPDYQLISPTYNCHDPDHASTQLDQVIGSNEFELIIGSSLGGFWAMLMGQQHCIPALVVNPSVMASENLKKYSSVPSMSNAYIPFESDLLQMLGESTREPCTVILGSNDVVIPEQPVEFLIKRVKVINTDWEHRLPKTAEAAELIIQLANELMGNTIGCQE